jgi:tetratricopeptide (TPR) repeat protein
MDFPDIPSYQDDLATALNNLAENVRHLSRVSESEALYRKALAIDEALANLHPDVPKYQSALVQGRYKLARTLKERGEYEEARMLLEEPVNRERAKLRASSGIKDATDHIQNRASFRDLVVLMAEVEAGLGDHAAAARLLQEVPWDETFDPEFVPPPAQAEHFLKAARVSIECVLLAERDSALSPEERARAAREYASRARSWLDEAARRGKDTFVILTKRADLLTNSPVPEFRDPQLALQLARRIVEQRPDDAVAQRTLGWALYRTGDWESSVEALTRSLWRELKGNDGGWYVLAMAYWQLGDQAKARAEFDKAEAGLPEIDKIWHEPLYPDPLMLRRLRAEAAALLGVRAPQGEEKSKPAAGTTSPPK